ncbi:hypothetical protein WJX73_005742 [Symbiochloris irregularis]|uniref:Thymidine kinase n=1 Tax=Symbiochloris irregularis TaxID=706552 RepID=A0AAW1Q0B4_9CHLO
MLVIRQSFKGNNCERVCLVATAVVQCRSASRLLWRPHTAKHAHDCSLRLIRPSARKFTTGCRAALATEVQRPLEGSDQRPLHSRPEDQAETSTSAPTQGRLQLIVGPMFAGKTTRLIAEIHALVPGVRFAAVKSDKDVRYGTCSEFLPNTQRPNGSLHTHNGHSQVCYALPTLKHMRQLDDYEKLQAIFIDEGHFFEDLKEFCDCAVDHERKHVFVAGIDSDFQRNSIGQIADLFPRCDELHPLS